MSQTFGQWDQEVVFEPEAFGFDPTPLATHILPKEEGTLRLGQCLGAAIQEVLGAGQEPLEAALFLGLVGTLGAGKTTLVRGLASAFSLESEVTSPTYTLVQLYPSSPLTLVHMDLYRLEHLEDLESIGYWDYIDQPLSIVCAEWFSAIPGSFPKGQDAVVVNLDHLPNGEGRSVKIWATQGIATQIMSATASHLEQTAQSD